MPPVRKQIPMKPRIDPLTGNSYDKEVSMYMRYHGLSEGDARRVVDVVSSHLDREAAFSSIIQSLLAG